MEEGRYVGHHSGLGAILVMTEQCVMRGSGASRMLEGEQSQRHWSLAEKMELPVGPVKVAAVQERRMYVTRADVERYDQQYVLACSR